MTQEPLRLLDLFSGIGGFSYAAERLVGGFRTVAFCEVDPFCRRVLEKHWPQVPQYSDIRRVRGTPDEVDVITAGFPCQDLSTAGKRLGFAGDRSVLFYEVIRLAREFRPQFLLLENVRGLLSHANGETFQEVLFQIAKAGFDAEWAVVPASGVGACHRRERVWIVAYASDLFSHGGAGQLNGESGGGEVPESGDGDRPTVANADHTRLEGREPVQRCEGAAERPAWTGDPRLVLSPDWRSFVSEPVLRRGDDGLRGRVDRLKALGNAVVPQVAAVPLRRILELSTGG